MGKINQYIRRNNLLTYTDTGVKIRVKYPPETLHEPADSGAFSKKVLESYNSFIKSIKGWTYIAYKNFV